jgi:hypothetical protein
MNKDRENGITVKTGKDISRRDFLKSLLLLTASACTPRVPEEWTTPTPKGDEPQIYKNTPLVETGTQVKTDKTPEPEASPTPSPERPDLVKAGEGGLYSEKQIELIENGAFKKQEEDYTKWVVDFWGKADNRPFHPETVELKFKYVFDPENSEDSGKAGVLLEALGDYKGRTFTFPYDTQKGEFRTNPPATPSGNFSIPEGWGPLELSGGDKGYLLSINNGEWVRRNPETGNVTQVINKEGQWEDVALPEPQAWDVKEKGVPELHKGNANYIPEEDKIIFKIDEGEHYIDIPQAGMVENENGELVESSVKVVLHNKLNPNSPAKKPEIYSIIEEGKRSRLDSSTYPWYARYDLEKGEWSKKYETLIIKEEHKISPLISQIIRPEGGFVHDFKSYVRKGSNESLTDYYFETAGQIKRVYSELSDTGMGGALKKSYWMQGNYGNGNNNVDILLMTENDYGVNWIGVIDSRNRIINPPRLDVRFSREELFELIQQSSYYKVILPGPLKSKNIERSTGFFKTASLFEESKDSRIGILQIKHGYEKDQVLLYEGLLKEDYENIPENVRTGFGMIYYYRDDK